MDNMQIFNEIGIKDILIYVIGINVMGFLFMGYDKWKAKKDIWRTPERTFFIISLLGGSIGTLIGMYFFRHKTKKKKFTIGIPIILVINIFILFVVFR